MCDDKLMTFGEWESLSAESRHKIKMFTNYHFQILNYLSLH